MGVDDDFMNKSMLCRVLFTLLVNAIAVVNGFSQQNFFNVPSSDITPKNQIFFQQQFNVLPNFFSSNTTFCYGLGKNSEIGLNVFGLTYAYNSKKMGSIGHNQQSVFPSIGINMQKQLLGYKKYSLFLGAQTGFLTKPVDFEYYVFLNNRLVLEKFKWVVGLYVGNNNYLGIKTGNSIDLQDLGIQLGAEYRIIEDKLFLQVDYISGQSSFSNLILGGGYKFTKHWVLSSGFQIPNTKITSSYGLIFELTYLP
jgi:hypothetical protein